MINFYIVIYSTVLYYIYIYKLPLLHIDAVKLPSCSCCTSKLASNQAVHLLPAHLVVLWCPLLVTLHRSFNIHKNCIEALTLWAAKLLSWSRKRQATSWTACSKTQMLLHFSRFLHLLPLPPPAAAAASYCCFAASFPCCYCYLLVTVPCASCCCLAPSAGSISVGL